MKNQRGGFGVGLIVGLLLGLAMALGVALYVTKAPVPFINKGAQRTAEQDAVEAERNKNWDPHAALAGKAGARPGSGAPSAGTSGAPVLPTEADNGRVTPLSQDEEAAADTEAEKPPTARGTATRQGSRRDAAAILAGQGDSSDGASPEDPSAEPASKPGKAAASGVGANVDPFIYYVQVGAYSRAEDAERKRASLALSGFRASVSEREQNGRTVHRVRLGPFTKKSEADAQKERVQGFDPDATLVRVERSGQ